MVAGDGHGRLEQAVEVLQMLPIDVANAVDGLTRGNAAEPAIAISRRRIGMHDERTRGSTRPFTDQPRAAPRRRGLDNVRL